MDRIVAKNLAELYRLAADRYGDLPAFATRINESEWKPVSFRQLYNEGRTLATGLLQLGVKARDHIGLFADNRYEWILSDYGILMTGAADVPRGSDITDEEMIYIVNHARLRIVFAENRSIFERLVSHQSDMPDLSVIIIMDSDTFDPAHTFNGRVYGIGEVSRLGISAGQSALKTVDERIENIDPEDLFTLIYTSGTTGKPKGVMLSHANMISQTKSIPVSLSCTDRVLSILPVWHIFERVFEVYTICCGTCTYYSGIRTLGEDLKSVEPTFMGSAPRLWESLHQRIRKRLQEAHPMRRLLFRIAYFLSRCYKDSNDTLSGNNLQLSPQTQTSLLVNKVLHLFRLILVLPWYGFLNAAVLETIRQSAGGSLKATVSGGGALPVEIDQFFNYIGISVLEGYGLTETSPVIAVRTHEDLVIGTVGPVVSSTSIQIVDLENGQIIYPNHSQPDLGRGVKGEIWVKGPQVMKGYYREPERTSETIVNGWLKTGDIGMITFNNCLKILGRSKSTVVLRSGENLEPEPIEMRLNQSPLIDHCMVVGQDQKHLGLLLVPSLEGARMAGIDESTLAELSENPQFRALVRKEIKTLISTSAGFKSFELIHDFAILTETFTVGIELTNLYKLKRHVVEEKYMDRIKEIFDA